MEFLQKRHRENLEQVRAQEERGEKSFVLDLVRTSS